MRLSRRALMQGAATGLAAVSMPGFLACARPGGPASAASAATPANPFLDWFGLDEAALSRVLSELASRGATFADVYLQHRRGNSISMEDGIVSEASTSIEQGAGVRVVVGDQTGFAFTEDLSLESLLGAARTAAAIAKGAAAPAPSSFAYGSAAELYRLELPWSAVGVDRKLPLLTRLEALAKGADSRITKVSLYYGDSEERVLVADLTGRVQTDIRPMTRLWCNVVASKDGVTVSNGANLAGRRGVDWYTDDKLQLLAKQAVERTTVLFDARRPTAGEMPVVLAAGASGILLHEAIGHGLEADFNRKNISIYASMVGKSIAPDFVTIVDSGVEPHERGAIAFDDEGNPSERTVLVEKGVLKGYLHDQISAKHYGVKPTGSGRRESFRFAPMPRMRCTFMEDGPHTRDEIVASVKNGIIAETFTNGQVQIGAGDFTFYIKNGWLIENGRITAPIKDVNIIGNGPDALQKVSMVGNDGELDIGGWTCGKDGQGVPVSQGLPTVLVSSMTVGGTHA